MRTLMACVALTAVMLLPGCATVSKYPAFGNAAGGRLVLFDRQGVKNVLPPSDSKPVVSPQSGYSSIR